MSLKTNTFSGLVKTRDPSVPLHERVATRHKLQRSEGLTPFDSQNRPTTGLKDTKALPEQVQQKNHSREDPNIREHIIIGASV